MTEQPDQAEELLQELRHGEKEALAKLFSLYRPKLWRLVNFRMDPRLAQRIDPDDVLQEAYLNAEKRLEHYFKDSAQSFFVWLRAIVNQTMIDLHRRHIGAHRRDARREVSLNGGPSPFTTSTGFAAQLVGSLTSPSQAAVRAELIQRVEEALQRMDPIDREVLALRHFEELTNSEVAEVLGIEQKAASIRYVRALGRLRAILASVPGFFDSQAGPLPRGRHE